MPDKNMLEGDAMLFPNELRPDTEAMLQEELIRQHGIKYTLVLTAELEKMALSVGQVYDDNSKPDVITTAAYFRKEATPVLDKDDGNVQAAIAMLLRHLYEYTNEGLGWRLKRVVALDLGLARYQPFEPNTELLPNTEGYSTAQWST